jgi:hypothetical protein
LTVRVAVDRLEPSELYRHTPIPHKPNPRIELDTHLGDCVALHVAHDQLHRTKVRANGDGRLPAELVRQKPG